MRQFLVKTQQINTFCVRKCTTQKCRDAMFMKSTSIVSPFHYSFKVNVAMVRESRHLSLHSVMSRFQFSWTSDTLERIGAASSPCFFIRRSQLASWSCQNSKPHNHSRRNTSEVLETQKITPLLNDKHPKPACKLEYNKASNTSI